MPDTARPIPEHPDPQWWMRLPQAGRLYALDVCSYCGHTRDIHGPSGCTSRSRSLFDRSPCDYTNRAGGCLFRATHPANALRPA